ncbi:unnamed protein product [Phytophthora lilii]|uniref:Unnamed protein product n=1 Tax=Phytophthora lilii TaxID=2077276 RepID=A0A9W6XEI5_9STRA|nr:unnamed protein product [Phytophthora lilii]
MSSDEACRNLTQSDAFGRACQLHVGATQTLLARVHSRSGALRAKRAGWHVEVASTGPGGLPEGARAGTPLAPDVVAREAQNPSTGLRRRVPHGPSTRPNGKAGVAASRGGAHAAVRRVPRHAALAVVPRFWHRQTVATSASDRK